VRKDIAPIIRAREFIAERVLLPVINSPSASKKSKDVTSASLRWLQHFERVGDLLVYMSRFDPKDGASIYSELHAQGFETFEDIREELDESFGAYRGDKTRLDDFVISQQYSSQQILIAAETYDTRSGGILTLGAFGHHKAVFIKATLSGGKYPNEWLEPGKRLKYFLKSIREEFKESFQHNRAIIEFPHVPVYAFVRPSKNSPFEFSGIFGFVQVHQESNGSKWFELERRNLTLESEVATLGVSAYERDLNDRLSQSHQDDSEARRKRLLSAPPLPNKVSVQSEAYVRNTDVIAEVLARAHGICESCSQPAPFTRRSDGTPYLEVHHRIRLADDGEDTIENAIALCPNCHRKAHYG
jgi:5-methylcytosine-specific restriction enzyme A